MALVLAALLFVGAPASGAPGDLVVDYGVGGTHTIPQTGGPHWIGAMAVRPGGEAILTGSSIGAGSGEQSFWVSEIAADGMSRQDAVDIGLGAAHEIGTAISLQPGGSYFVAGERGALGGVDTDMFVASFDVDGELVSGFGLALPGVPNGVQVLTETGTERATSVFTDGSKVVVSGWRDTPGFPGVVTRLLSTGALDPSFGGDGSVDLTWPDSGVFDVIETTVWPTSGSDYLAIGRLSAGAYAEVRSMIVSETGVVSPSQLLLTGEIGDNDSIPLSDGTVAVATELFSDIEGSGIMVTKVSADGAVVGQSDFVALGDFSAGLTITDLNDGTLAVAAATGDLPLPVNPYGVYQFGADAEFAGTIVSPTSVGALLGDVVARASGTVAADGGLLVTAVVDPADSNAISGELVVTKYAGHSGRFVDDDASVHEADIEAIAEAGITLGCNPPVNDRFCPEDSVTRGQMAAFLVRAFGFTDDGGGDLFVDDDASEFESEIDRLATAGITFGCNPPVNDRFCPEDSVTRGQMAAFLVRAFGFTDDGGGDLFVDDDASEFESEIDRLATAGITFGCNPPVNDRYCPDDPVTRAQMASFLVRAIPLP